MPLKCRSSYFTILIWKWENCNGLVLRFTICNLIELVYGRDWRWEVRNSIAFTLVLGEERKFMSQICRRSEKETERGKRISWGEWRNGHHHHVTLVARISLTLSRHSSLSFNALGRYSGQHPVSSHSCWMYVRSFARPCVGVHKSTSLMSSSLLLQQCPACLVRLTWIVFVIGGRWPYSWCLVGCCRQDLFKIARSWVKWWEAGEKEKRKNWKWGKR